MQQFFPAVDYDKLQQVFQYCLTEVEIYDTFITKQRTFVLVTNTVPPKPSYYVPRFLSNRIKVNESILKADCSDVFVFKNTIARYKLSQIVSPHFTADSTSQLSNLTCRFIYLEEYEDWAELKKLAKVPIHLINYEAFLEDPSNNGTNCVAISDNATFLGPVFSSKTVPKYHFILEDTSAASEILKKLGFRNERVYMSEEDFVQQQLCENSSSACVCICDTPGMGKTYLLANIARLMVDQCTSRLVVFISLAAFSTNSNKDSVNTILNPEASLRNLLKLVLPSEKNPELLLKLLQNKLIQMEIFFDGLDEVPSEKVEWTKQVFQTISTNFPTIRMYITARSHMRQGLEESVGVVAHDILPFNHQNQLDFLVQYWCNIHPGFDMFAVKTYATSCLEKLKESLTSKDKEITGIPLLCQLIAEVYADKVAKFNSTKTGTFFDVSLKISAMYQKFIERRIKLVVKNKEEFDLMKLVHIRHALKLIFPNSDFYGDNLFEIVKVFETSNEILKMGIVQKHLNGTLEFIHRTFAEHLVAEYFVIKLQEDDSQRTEYWKRRSKIMLRDLLQTGYLDDFVHPVIVSFFNFALSEVSISEKMRIQGAKYISIISHGELIKILCACCRHNLFNIFSFLREFLTKWDNSSLLDCFSNKNSYALLKVCIRESTSPMFHSCIRLLTELVQFDLVQMNTIDKDNTLFQTAAECANYEAVEYFANRVSLKKQSLLEACVKHSGNVEKRENILNLLHSKEPTLIKETRNILVKYLIDVRLFKILVKFGANLSAVIGDGYNCIMLASGYMSPTNYHELVQFLLTDCKAKYLFLPKVMKWKSPLAHVVECATLWDATLELLLNIPGNDINMKDEFGDNLLFCAVQGNKLDNLKHLVKRGLDYNGRATEKKASLLHMAAEWGSVELVRYVLSLELDPNSCDEDLCTPIHYVVDNYVGYSALSVLKLLVENGVNVRAKNNEGQTALHLFAKVEYSPKVEIIEYLIRNGAEVTDVNNDGNTPLHLCNYWTARDCLVKLGANIHAKNKNGQTPAQINPCLWEVTN